MMAKIILLFNFLGIICILPVMFKISDKDLRTYSELMASSAGLHEKTGEQASCQKRLSVKKDVWRYDKTALNLHIESQSSQLFFSEKDSRKEMTEELYHVKAFMQEKLYYLLPDGRQAYQDQEGRYIVESEKMDSHEILDSIQEDWTPMQSLRYIESDKACYHYQSQTFRAENVLLYTYKITGHEPVLDVACFSPQMSGKADLVEFVWKGKSPKFQAQGFMAKFPLQEQRLKK